MKKDLPKKEEFDLYQWRVTMGDKLCLLVTQGMAAELLCYTDRSMISRIEQGINPATPQMVFICKLLQRMPIGQLRSMIQDLKLESFIKAKKKQYTADNIKKLKY